MPYNYDIFISYRRKPPVSDWVHNHFAPELEQWLPQYGRSSTPKTVFVDKDAIEDGSFYPGVLSHGLTTSKLLVPVWSPPYFDSSWCRAELDSMQAREKLLGLFNERKTKGLVFPVVFADGESFPAEYKKDRQYRDFHEYNSHLPVFRQSVDYLEFLTEIKKFAEALMQALATVPRWRRDFPAVDPQPQKSSPIRLLRP